MLIFYAWVVFLAAVILSVPIVYMIESSRNKKAREAANPQVDADMQADEEEVSDEMPDEMAGFDAESPAGEDDFSQFEKEFK